MYNRARVKRIIKHCRNIREYILSVQLDDKPSPGQFIMLWIPSIGEIPLSVSNYSSKSLSLIVAKVGKVTTYLFDNVKVGDCLGVRGPYGNGFTIPRNGSRTLMIAGGVGLAPLLYLARTVAGKAVIDFVVGFKSISSVFHVDTLKRLANKLIITTDDGSFGVKGSVVDGLKQLDDLGYDYVYVCGNELMMKRIATEFNWSSSIVEFSLERIIKCGIGLCGSCVLDGMGLRVCSDGPVFRLETLLQLEDFGVFWRDSSGRKVPLGEKA